MDYLHRLKKDLQHHLFAVVLGSNLLLISLLTCALTLWNLSLVATVLLLSAVALITAIVIASTTSGYYLQPLKFIWQAIMHVSPGVSQTAAPNLTQVHLGKHLAQTLSLHVYHLAGVRPGDHSKASPHGKPYESGNESLLETICHYLPLPVMALAADGSIIVQNAAAAALTGDTSRPDGQRRTLNDVMTLSFSGESTFDSWLQQCRQNRATASGSWDFIKIESRTPDSQPLFGDMVTYYTKDHPSGIESIICLIDRTDRYRDDLKAISFIALAAHELRSPLTLLRSYIDAFDEELGASLPADMADYLQKMQASAQQFTTFINNILNVARVDDGELKLELKEEAIEPLIRRALQDMQRLATIHQAPLSLTVAPGLPTVAVDKSLIYEVIVNLLDNAIKYSQTDPKQITVSVAPTADGLVAVQVSDTGVGIAANVLPHLFEKFYRSHHTRGRAGGTGLGLYLCRVIIEAHGGSIQVESRQGQGTTISFTLMPFKKLAGQDEQDGIVRVARGWIKNHNLYKRT